MMTTNRRKGCASKRSQYSESAGCAAGKGLTVGIFFRWDELFPLV